HRGSTMRIFRSAMLTGVRIVVLCSVLASATLASADPVSVQLKTDVPSGQKPSMVLTGNDTVSDVKVELARDDGQTFTQKVGALRPKQTATVPLGDGKPG